MAINIILDPNDVPTMPTGGAAGDILIKTSGTNYDAEWSAGPTIGSTVYVATTGDDISGDGSSGNPFATVAKAISVLPDIIKQEFVIDVADGTYAEPIQVSDKITVGSGKIRISGNTTTPANVTFTGANGTVTIRGGTSTSLALIMGGVNVELEGVKLDGTANVGVIAFRQSFVTLDRCVVTGTLTTGMLITDQSGVEFCGNNTISGWSSFGVSIQFSSIGSHGSAGTLTLTGPSSPSGTVWGFHLSAGSSFGNFGLASCNITITNVVKGFEVGLASIFTHQGASSTISVTNASTPSASSGILTTDNSSWSTTQTVVMDHFTNAYEANSVSYIESAGTRTLTNIGTTSVPTQNSVIYLP
jgi:hypothetical protein